MVTQRSDRCKTSWLQGNFVTASGSAGSFLGKWRHAVQVTIEEGEVQRDEWSSSYRWKQKSTEHPTGAKSAFLHHTAGRATGPLPFGDEMDHRIHKQTSNGLFGQSERNTMTSLIQVLSYFISSFIPHGVANEQWKGQESEKERKQWIQKVHKWLLSPGASEC